MSAALDTFERAEASFEGKIKDVAFYTTVKGDVYRLCFARGIEKPLALPQNYPSQPNVGDHVSALNVTEGREWWFVGHRTVVTIKPPDFEVWRKPSTIPADRRAQAEAIILDYLKTHSEVSADDVAAPICVLFPERDPRIVGVIFLGLSKRGSIHKVGYRPTERSAHHGSPIAIWHLILK